MKLMIPLALMLGVSFFAYGQTYAQEVLQLSQKYYQGTARSIGLGNAVGAVGGDFTAIDINPAGLAIYRSPQLTLSADINHQHANTLFLGKETTNDKFNLAISNISLVIASVKTDNKGKPVKDGWVSVNFGIGLQRTSNFYGNVTYSGNNTRNYSVLNSYSDEANATTQGGVTVSPAALDSFSLPLLAYNSGLLLYDSFGSRYVPGYYYGDSTTFTTTRQSDALSMRGATNDIVISVGGNYSNQLYIGGSVLVPTYGYHFDRTFTEINTSPMINYYEGVTQQDVVHSSGIGISGALGIIYRFADNFRAGISFQAPIFYSLNDEYHYSITSTLKGYSPPTFTAQSPTGYYHYSIITPPRTTVSAVYLFKKKAFISADFEHVNYPAGYLNSSFEGALEINQTIRSVLSSGNNLRVGAEYRMGPLSLRAGYGLYSTTFKKSLATSGYAGGTQIFSFGAGVRSDNFFFDFGYQKRMTKYFYLPYSLQNYDMQGGTTKDIRNSFVFTVGTKF